MPPKLDPHVATIEDWLTAEPQLTALAIVGRLSERYPEQFGMRQHSIVQRLLKALRKMAAEKAHWSGTACRRDGRYPAQACGRAIEGPTPPPAPPIE